MRATRHSERHCMPALCYAASRPERFHLFSAFSIKVDTELAVPVDVAPRAEATAYETAPAVAESAGLGFLAIPQLDGIIELLFDHGRDAVLPSGGRVPRLGQRREATPHEGMDTTVRRHPVRQCATQCEDHGLAWMKSKAFCWTSRWKASICCAICASRASSFS